MSYTYNQLIQMFIDVTKQTKNVDYSDKASIREHNILVDKYRNIAQIINTNFPEHIKDFELLLNSDDERTRICCAVCIVELFSTTLSEKQRAIDTINQYIISAEDKVEKMGLNIWLKNITGEMCNME